MDETTSLEARVEAITPAMASQYLERNENRYPRKRKVDAYARDMAAGRWLLTGSAIQFDREGVLRDGQQRLLAIIKANVTVPMLVVRDISAEAQQVIDTGVPRRFYDMLTLRGEKDTRVLAAACMVLYRISQGVTTASLAEAPTYSELDEVLESHPGVRYGIIWGRVCWRLAPASATVALYYLFGTKDSAKADVFFNRLVNGAELEEMSPIYRLRERLIRNATEKARLPPVELWALMIKAWNLFVTNQPAGPLAVRWRTQGATPEPFPKILGPDDRPRKRRRR